MRLAQYLQKKSWLDIEVCGEDEISTLRKEVAATEVEAEQLRKQLARQLANWLYRLALPNCYGEMR